MDNSFVPMIEKTKDDKSKFCDLVIKSESMQQVVEESVEKVPMISAEELDAIKNQAREEGYQKGMNAAIEEISAQKEQLSGLINLILLPTAFVDEQVQAEIINLSTWIAKTILQAELTLDPKKILVIFEEINSLLPNMNQLRTLYLAPDDHQIIHELLDKDRYDIPLDNLQSDPSLSRGEYRIDTTDSEVDASIEARVQELVLNTLDFQRGNNV